MKKVLITDTEKMSGIYLIEFPNNKVYIGQSQNIHSRMLEHNNRARLGHRGDGKDIQRCDKAINKYFPEGVKEYYVLEECNIKDLDEKEKYWIDFYNALDKDYGYNFLDKGNVSGRRGVDNVNASLNEEQLKKVIDLLKNDLSKSCIEIANIVNANVCTIYNINYGYRYTQDNLEYPLRKQPYHLGKNKILDYFSSEEELINLKEDLKYSWWLKIETDILNKYSIPLKILHEINTGKRFKEIGNYEYPIRNKNVRNINNFTKEDVLEILSELRNTKESMENIGKKYGMHRDSISKINKGSTYLIKDYDYPARKAK